MTKFCIPVQAKTVKELVSRSKIVATKADIVELWLDQLKPSELAKLEPKLIISSIKKPILVVNKTKAEKGKWQGTEKERLSLLYEFGIAGAAYIDVGLSTNSNHLKTLIKSLPKVKFIVSWHDFAKTPSLNVLEKLLNKAKKLDPDFIKIVTTAKKSADNQIIAELCLKHKTLQKKLIAFCMGKYGKVSRVDLLKHKSPIIYAAIDAKSKSALGQLTINEYKNLI